VGRTVMFTMKSGSVNGSVQNNRRQKQYSMAYTTFFMSLLAMIHVMKSKGYRV